MTVESIQRNKDMSLSGCMYKRKENQDFADLHKILLKFELF
jgi:hypothetical protein